MFDICNNFDCDMFDMSAIQFCNVLHIIANSMDIWSSEHLDIGDMPGKDVPEGELGTTHFRVGKSCLARKKIPREVVESRFTRVD